MEVTRCGASMKKRYTARPSSDSEHATWFVCLAGSGLLGFDSEIAEVLVTGDEGKELAEKICKLLEQSENNLEQI